MRTPKTNPPPVLKKNNAKLPTSNHTTYLEVVYTKLVHTTTTSNQNGNTNTRTMPQTMVYHMTEPQTNHTEVCYQNLSHSGTTPNKHAYTDANMICHLTKP